LQNKPLHFITGLVVACAAITLFWWVFAIYVFGWEHADVTELFLHEMPFFIIGMAGGVFIKLVRASMQKQVDDANIAAKQKESELNLLQSQLSPHFLFNTLNNLYGISITQHERVPALLLKLSDLLRYSVYDTKKPFVPLKEELDYINNYIDFEKIRISDRLVLQTDIQKITDATVMVAPMVLVVFIENAFKHSKNTLEQKIYIAISLKTADGSIIFTVKNSFDSNPNRGNAIKEHSGMGLANTIKRLGLLYGNDYALEQFNNNGLYTVRLRLKIK
jgi:LytS/YehU family sensor histidine kinase